MAIRCLQYLRDLCLMAEYHSHTPQAMAYMNVYLQKFHDRVQVFCEVRGMKKDRQDAKEGFRELAVEQL